jgi:hypothetical protein
MLNEILHSFEKAFPAFHVAHDLAKKLIDLGFSKGVIAETIVSTYGIDGKPSAAPMGVTLIDDEHLTIDFFNSSTTLANVKANRCAVVNLTGSIEVYYRSAFKEANLDGVLAQEWFEKATVVKAPKLRLADAVVEVSLYHLEALGEEKSRALFKVRSLQASKGYPQAYCRAFSATLEAIIDATRIRVLAKDNKQQKRVSALLKLIENCDGIVTRTAPNSSYYMVMADLRKRIASWEQK